MDPNKNTSDILETNIANLLADGTDVPPLAPERSASIVEALQQQATAPQPAPHPIEHIQQKGFSLTVLAMVAALAVMLGFAASTLMQSTSRLNSATAPSPTGTETQTLEKSLGEMHDLKFEEAPIGEVIAFYEKISGKSAMSHPAIPDVKITFESREPLTTEGAKTAIETMLSMNGISVTPYQDSFVRVQRHSALTSDPLPLVVNNPENPPSPQRTMLQAVPAKYETVTERVLVREAGMRTEMTPGKYEWVEEQVLVAEAGEEVVVTPAKYETREARVLVDRAEAKAGQQAEYKTVTQRVMVEPPTTTVETRPAQYKSVRVRKMVEAPIARQVPVAPEYSTVTRQRLVSPASTRMVEVPAEYKTVKQRVLVEPPKTVSRSDGSTKVVPGKYETVEEQVAISSSSSTPIMAPVMPAVPRPAAPPLNVPTDTLDLGYHQQRGFQSQLFRTHGTTPSVSVGAQMCLVDIPAEYKMETRQIEVAPGKYETRTSRVMVKPARPVWKMVDPNVAGSSISPSRSEPIEIPAEYRTEKQRVMVEAPKIITNKEGFKEAVPAKYEIRDSRVMVKAPQSIPARPQNGQEMELVPAKFKWVEEQVLHTESPERLKIIPGKFETRTERVMIAPGQYETQQKRVQVEPPRFVEDNSPVEYETVRIQQLVEPARWVPKKPEPPEANTEQYERIVENPFTHPVDSPLSTFSIDVDTASYANTRRFLNSGSLPPPDAVRIEELINYFNYDDPEPQDDVPFAVATEVAACPWTPENQIVRIGLQAKRIDQEDVPPRNLVFLIDVSGSMRQSNKLSLLQGALPLLVEQLRPEDRLGIVVYAGSAGVVLEPADGTDKDKILAAIASLRGGGSTHGSQGIKRAYELARKQFDPKGINRVILCTDGDFNVGLTGGGLTRLIEEERESGVFLSVLGFGTGNINDRQMEELSNKGNGNYSYIDSMKEATKVLVEDVGGTLYTVAKDVKIQVEFNPAAVSSYRLLGYENRKMAAQDFNNDKKDAGEIGAGHSVTALYEIVPAKQRAIDPELPPLKYQSERKPNAGNDEELLTVNLRYKQPDGDKSKLLSIPMPTKEQAWKDASNNLRFASSVAAYGMILRGSAHKGKADWKLVRELASSVIGDDKNGHRAEFLELIEAASVLD